MDDTWKCIRTIKRFYIKHIFAAPPRLARMLLRMQQYDVSIKYVPRSVIKLADALSRVNPCNTGHNRGLDLSVHEVHMHLNASPTSIVEIRMETSKDSTLHALCEIISLGWPENRAHCLAHLMPFWNFRDELSVEDRLILKGQRIILPKSLHVAALEHIHYAHQGAEKCKLLAKEAVFWCGMNHDIDEMVKSCASCQAHQVASTKYSTRRAKHSWRTLSTDLFHWNGTEYLLIADLYSKFPIIRKRTNISSSTIINHLKGIFDEHGIPERLISDIGPQYSSEEFRIFSARYGFDHVTSSPLYPMSNGFIEITVQTVKRFFTKAKEGGGGPHLAMLCLRTTPIDHNLPSPCELLNGRRYKSNLPATSSRSNGDVNAFLQQRQNVYKLYYERTAKELAPLSLQ